MAISNGNSTSDKKKSVFKLIEDLRTELKKTIILDRAVESSHGGTGENNAVDRRIRKKRLILENRTKADQKEKDRKVEKEELASHFSGLRHELQLVAGLLPLYKIVKEEDDVTGDDDNDEDAEAKRKKEEEQKWEEVWTWGNKVKRAIADILNPLPQQPEDKGNEIKAEPLEDGTADKIKSEDSTADRIKPEDSTADKIKTKLLDVSKMVAEMKEKIQLSHRKKPGKLATEKVSTGVGKIEKVLLEKGNYKVFTEFQHKYQRLDKTTKLCFLCLAFFPDGVVIKKRLLVYWWIGEGLIDSTDKEKTMEDLADDVIDKLVDDGFLHIVDKMSGLEIDSYKMHPLVRSALVAQAKRVDFFDFEDSGMPTARVDSRSCKACLVDDSFIRQDRRPEYLLTYLAEGGDEPKDDKKLQVDKKLGQLQAFLNHNRVLVDLKSNLFSKMNNLNVLHLGRWQNSSRHHIEVETTDFLQGLKYMKHLKYISLQGVSQIRELPVMVCNLQFLRVLDLRACHNLQELPEDIGDLNLLTHLDISECFLLDGLPKSVSKLIQLQVMKGFVIGDPNNKKHCFLQDLKKFDNLRKLAIHTSNDMFPGEEELKAFKNFKNLEKLSISWGRGTLSSKLDESKNKKGEEHTKNANMEGSKRGTYKTKSVTERSKELTDPASPGVFEGKKQLRKEVQKNDDRAPSPPKDNEEETEPTNPEPAEFPEGLVKFDLQCFPHAKCPKWLNPQNLVKLEKLYIRGGEMKTLGEIQNQRWDNVQILLLKYLSGFMLTWDQLLHTFPKVVYLEKVNCPRLTFYPCNERGEWKRD